MTDTATETPTPVREIPETGPAEVMGKEELIEHFRAHHGLPHNYSRMSKAQLLETHAHWHDYYAYEEFKPEGRRHGSSDGRVDRRAWSEDRFIHTHIAIKPTDAQAEALAAIREGAVPGKVLSAGERKNLSELIDNDFSALKAQTKQFAHEAQAAEEQSIRDEWASKLSRVESWVDKARAMNTRHQEERRKLIAQADAAGITLAHSGAGVAGSVAGQEAALTEVKARYGTQLQSALSQIENQRLGCQRTILLAGVSAEGLTLLQSIPTAQEAMLQAAGGAKEITR